MSTIWSYTGGCDTYVLNWTSTPKLCVSIDAPDSPDFTITHVGINLKRYGTVGTVHVELYAADENGFPTGDVLSSGTYDGSLIDSDSPTVWSIGDFATSVVMSSYVVSYASPGYVIVVYADSLTPSWPYSKLYWHGVETGGYTYGHPSYMNTSSVWTSLSPIDLRFYVLGETSTGLLKPTTPSPADDAGPGIDFSTRTLSWVNGGGAATYTIRIGPYPLAYNVVSLSQAGTSYTIPSGDIPLYKDNPITWRVDAELEGETAEGDVWTFDPRPAKPTTPTPESAATEQKLTQTFEWVDGGGSATYDVWIGSDKILNSTAGLSYLVPDTYLGYKSEYTWRVDAANVWGTTTGDNWTFTTFALDPPSPTYYYPDGNYWYYLLTTDDGWGDPPPTGTENVDYMITGNINMMSAHRKLMACAADRLWYET